MIAWLAVVGCDRDPDRPPPTPPVCDPSPCVAEVSSSEWRAAEDTRWAGYDLALHGGTLYAGAPGIQGGSGLWQPRVVAITLPELAATGSWSGGVQYSGTGYGVAAADVDGDGVAEVAVGAFNDQPDPDIVGVVYLVHGVPSGEVSVKRADSLRFSSPQFTGVGLRVGFADLVAGGGVELLASGSGMIPDWPGAVYVIDPTLRGDLREEDAITILRGPPGVGEDSVAWDADGDGQPDLVASLTIGAGVGWFPGPLVPGELAEGDAAGVWSARPESPGDCLGDQLEALGDVTGDGLPDLALAAPNYLTPFDLTGRAYVVAAGDLQPGPADDLGIQVHGAELGEGLGHGLSSGDVDGDGQHDLLVGAPGLLPGVWPGMLMVFAGPVAGTLREADAVAVLRGERDLDMFGYSSATVDTDGDDRDDVIVSAPGADEDRGALYLVPGSALLP